MKEIESQGRIDENSRILDHLMQLQQQLEALSERIEAKKSTQSRVVQLEEQIYQKMEEDNKLNKRVDPNKELIRLLKKEKLNN